MANPLPVTGKQWDNSGGPVSGLSVTISSPTSGAGTMLVFATMFTGGDNAIECVTSGGTGVGTPTIRFAPPASTNTVGVGIWEIAYTGAAPTSVTVQHVNALGGMYITVAVTELQDADSLDVVSASEDTATGSNATATSLPDTTDAQGTVFGVWTQEDFPGGAVSNGSGWTTLWDLDNGNDFATMHVEYKTTTAGSNDPVWSHSALTYHCAGIAYAGVAAVGSTPKGGFDGIALNGPFSGPIG